MKMQASSDIILLAVIFLPSLQYLCDLFNTPEPTTPVATAAPPNSGADANHHHLLYQRGPLCSGN